MNASEIIAVIIHGKDQATKLLRYSLDGGTTIKPVPAGSTIHGAMGGIILHIGGSFVDGDTTYAVEGKRSTITWLDKTNFATLNGANCVDGIFLHNETEIANAASKTLTISYGIQNPANNVMIKFYADVQL